VRVARNTINKGYSLGAASRRPKHIDECRRLDPATFAGIEMYSRHATEASDALREFWEGEDLADGQEVRDAGQQPGEENDSYHAAEVA